MNYLFVKGATPKCLDAADANDDGLLDVSDPVYMLLYLFKGENPIPAPYPDAGFDTTADELKC